MPAYPPLRLCLVWKDKKGNKRIQPVLPDQTWASTAEARQALDRYLKDSGLERFELVEQPTPQMKGWGLVAGPVFRSSEIWDSKDQLVAGYIPMLKVEPVDPAIERELDPQTQKAFAALDTDHGPWRLYQQFSDTKSNQSFSAPVERHGVVLRFPQLAGAMEAAIFIVRSGKSPLPGEFIRPSGEQVAQGLSDAKMYQVKFIARGEDGFQFEFPEAPEVEDARN